MPDPSQLPDEALDFAARMFNAARSGDSELLLAAVDNGLPANLTNDKGNTLLMLAAYSGHAGLVSELLTRGADPNRSNDNSQNPVAGAVFKGHEEVVRVLVEGGADPRKGKPTAIETAYMFNKTNLLGVLGTKEGDISDSVPKPLNTGWIPKQ